MTDQPSRKRIALVAHDNMKQDMVAWARTHVATLRRHVLWATGTTGSLVAKETGLDITCVRSGPLGGDLQLGAMIAEGKLDILIFFVDPLSAMPHDVDIKALLRVSVLRQTVAACNRATADYIINSTSMSDGRGRTEHIANG
jgi:methylglyoxal synthase